jgi:calcium-dependent protein kinase
MKTVVGTYWYMAPEVIKGKYTKKCDIWSAGVLFYAMLCGFPPFFGKEPYDLKRKILKGNVKFKDEAW